MKKILLLSILMLTAPASALAEEEVQTLSGISILGDDEAPKSLFIVPWKSADLGDQTELSSKLLNEKLEAIDKEVFQRELEFHSLTTAE